jgi:uncharacterized phage protein (TIGR02220 family)
MNGWVKIHRKMLENPVVFYDADHLAIWIYLLLNATHKDMPVMFKGKKTTLKPGQLITGRKVISEELSVSESKVKRVLLLFESDQQIDRIRSNKNSVITILNWDKYQTIDQQNDQQMTSKRPADDQQMTTNKKLRTKELNKKDIVEHLNFATGKNYKAESSLTSRLISARLNEGFTVDDFKRVIDAKVSEWGHDEKMQKFLRPETLFGTKFESYLNSNITPIKKKLSDRDQALQDWMNAGGDPDEFQYYRS